MSGTEPTSPGCVYVISRYPLVTHTFILHEVRALRARGMRVETVSIRRVDDREILTPLDAEEYRSTYALRPTSLARLAAAHLRALGQAPGAYVRTLWGALALGRASARDLLWQLFYFGEAMLLWDWMQARGLRHAHAHHGNVASDVAMLMTRFGNASGAGDRESGRWSWSLTVHGPTDLLDPEGHRLAAKVTDADAVICISDFARSQLTGFAVPEDRAKLHVIHAGVDVEAFRPARQPDDADQLVEILNVAAMSARKGHAILLEALALLRRSGVAVRATLVGDGAERARLEATAVELGLEDAVRFAGAVGQDRIRDFYRRADIFCLPSFAEGIPRVLMEAMAMGVPVVATHVMGVPELVDHGRSGLVVAPGRADLLADALMQLAGDPELRTRLGAEGRRRVESSYDIRDTASALHAVLMKVIAGDEIT